MSIKISIIGAGSSVFSLNMIRDLCTTKNLSGCTVHFMDIDEGRLDASYTLCKRYADECELKLELLKTTNREECLTNADFVINTALHVGYDKWIEGWEIAKKHGYSYGGSLHIMHDEGFWINFYQLKLIEDVYLDIQRICPNAWYLLVSNPVSAGVTYMKRKYPKAKIIGLCHGVGGVHHISNVLGLNPKDVQFEVSGVNHFIWLTHFTHKGQNAFPLLDRWIKEKSEEYFKTCRISDAVGPKAVDLYKKFGVFPIGDTGNPGGGAWAWWYHTNADTEKKWNEGPDWWFKEIYFNANKVLVDSIHSAAYDIETPVTDVFPPGNTGEPMIKVIESIAFDIPRMIVTNIINDGEYVAGVPKDFQVELNTWVDAQGVRGVKQKPLPLAVQAYMQSDRIAMINMELSAYEHGDFNGLLSLIMMDPWTKTEQQARDLINDIFNMDGMETLKNHFSGGR
ncbi:MAG: hypothetical protein FWE05_10260 [Defluviitaleaceae bacterium]|nr:hypothetical protein [Defluviitaleaceae bacterium]